MDAVQPRISLIHIYYYKQGEKPGLVDVPEKNFQTHILSFVADFGGFVHIYVSIKYSLN